MPMLSSAVFDNTGKPYDVSRILTPDFLFDRKKYEAYSKVYLPITYLLSYGVQFAGLTALVTHTACWYGRDLWQVCLQTREAQREESAVEDESAEHVGKGKNYSNSSGDILEACTSSTEAGMDASLCEQDVHSRLMRRYEDAPMTWYLATFVGMLAIGIFVVE